MLVNATSIDFVIRAAPTTTVERPQTTVLFFRTSYGSGSSSSRPWAAAMTVRATPPQP
jgi:hypothetical protein